MRTTRFIRFRRMLVEALLFVILLVLLLWAAAPLIYMVASSFKLPDMIWAWPPSLKGPYSLRNYMSLAKVNPLFFRHLWNTVVLTAYTVAVTLVLCFAAAYALSRYKRPWMSLPVFFMIAVRMFPPIVIMIPLFPLFMVLGLVDTIPALVLILCAFGVSMATLIMKTFVDEIPIALEESAIIDGCTALQAFLRIILPLAIPGVFATVVFVGIPVWNEYMFVLVFSPSATRTVPVTLASMMGNPMGVYWGAMLAGTVIHLLPVVILVALIQRRLVKGMALGAVKG
jgi:multiple sugar transport system permease protein